MKAILNRFRLLISVGIVSALCGVVVGLLLGHVEPMQPVVEDAFAVFSSDPEPQSHGDRVIDKYAYLSAKDCIKIYAVSNRFEVWDASGSPGLWETADTVEEARQIVDAYYWQWAKNIIGPELPKYRVMPDGELVE